MYLRVGYSLISPKDTVEQWRTHCRRISYWYKASPLPGEILLASLYWADNADRKVVFTTVNFVLPETLVYKYFFCRLLLWFIELFSVEELLSVLIMYLLQLNVFKLRKSSHNISSFYIIVNTRNQLHYSYLKSNRWPQCVRSDLNAAAIRRHPSSRIPKSGLEIRSIT